MPLRGFLNAGFTLLLIVIAIICILLIIFSKNFNLFLYGHPKSAEVINWTVAGTAIWKFWKS